ncbi:MAG: acyltransferase [Actinomycetota bacterium]|nr:acyltransferase [Actinomycetota bacterium]
MIRQVERGVRSLHRRAFLAWARRRVRAGRLKALGRDSLIVAPATMLAPHRIEIGARVLVLENVTFSVVECHQGRRHDPSLKIGDRTLVGHGVWFSCVGSIEVGSDVIIGHGALIGDSFHEYADRATPIRWQPMAEPRPVRIEDGACLGPGSVILSGARVGRGAYVAANAVVAGEVPDHSVAAGNPAEVVRRWDASRGDWVDSDDPRWRDLLTALTR